MRIITGHQSIHGEQNDSNSDIGAILGILSHKNSSPFDQPSEINPVEAGAILPFVNTNAGAVLPANGDVLAKFIPGYKEPGRGRVAELVEYAQRQANYGTMPGQAAALTEAISFALKPSAAFVFGTARGRVEALIARASSMTEVVTLDIPQEMVSDKTIDSNNLRYRQKIGVVSDQSIGEIFRSDPTISNRVHQILGDSMEFDATPFSNAMRVIVIDGNHALRNVLRDLRNAFIMANKDIGAVIILDDFRKLSPLNSGVEAAAVLVSQMADLPVLLPVPKPGEDGLAADAGIILVPKGFDQKKLIDRIDQMIELTAN